jgi:hypothetical protein
MKLADGGRQRISGFLFCLKKEKIIFSFLLLIETRYQRVKGKLVKKKKEYPRRVIMAESKPSMSLVADILINSIFPMMSSGLPTIDPKIYEALRSNINGNIDDNTNDTISKDNDNTANPETSANSSSQPASAMSTNPYQDLQKLFIDMLNARKHTDNVSMLTSHVPQLYAAFKTFVENVKKGPVIPDTKDKMSDVSEKIQPKDLIPLDGYQLIIQYDDENVKKYQLYRTNDNYQYLCIKMPTHIGEQIIAFARYLVRDKAKNSVGNQYCRWLDQVDIPIINRLGMFEINYLLFDKTIPSLNTDQPFISLDAFKMPPKASEKPVDPVASILSLAANANPKNATRKIPRSIVDPEDLIFNNIVYAEDSIPSEKIDPKDLSPLDGYQLIIQQYINSINSISSINSIGSTNIEQKKYPLYMTNDIYRYLCIKMQTHIGEKIVAFARYLVMGRGRAKNTEGNKYCLWLNEKDIPIINRLGMADIAYVLCHRTIPKLNTDEVMISLDAFKIPSDKPSDPVSSILSSDLEHTTNDTSTCMNTQCSNCEFYREHIQSLTNIINQMAVNGYNCCNK